MENPIADTFEIKEEHNKELASKTGKTTKSMKKIEAPSKDPILAIPYP